MRLSIFALVSPALERALRMGKGRREGGRGGGGVVDDKQEEEEVEGTKTSVHRCRALFFRRGLIFRCCRSRFVSSAGHAPSSHLPVKAHIKKIIFFFSFGFSIFFDAIKFHNRKR